MKLVTLTQTCTATNSIAQLTSLTTLPTKPVCFNIFFLETNESYLKKLCLILAGEQWQPTRDRPTDCRTKQFAWWPNSGIQMIAAFTMKCTTCTAILKLSPHKSMSKELFSIPTLFILV